LPKSELIEINRDLDRVEKELALKDLQDFVPFVNPTYSRPSHLKPLTTEFNELKEGRHDKVPYKTKFKILYSTTGIYCLYTCDDNLITATMKADFDDIYKEDVVEAFFWTEESSNIYFEYEVSPTNLELPILVPNYKGQFLGWRPWHYEGDRKTRHATHIEYKDGKVVSWTAEFFIPFKL
jgi:hypothetical protein